MTDERFNDLSIRFGVTNDRPIRVAVDNRSPLDILVKIGRQSSEENDGRKGKGVTVHGEEMHLLQGTLDMIVCGHWRRWAATRLSDCGTRLE